MYVDFRKLPRAKEPTSINGQIVEVDHNYNYLGTIIDSKLSFEANCEAVYKKANQRLHCLRQQLTERCSQCFTDASMNL